MKELIEGRWYWVSHDGIEWWPAKRASGASGGWTNEDTWEDFHMAVKYWILITLPDECPA